jgi:hypothetical protein
MDLLWPGREVSPGFPFRVKQYFRQENRSPERGVYGKKRGKRTGSRFKCYSGLMVLR